MALEVKSEVVTITPQIAAKWLSGSKNFRKRNLAKEAVYAEDMRGGRWDVNGETIKLNGDGSVKDGQGRLHACVAANVSFKSVVVSGVESDVNIDVGERRSLAQLLTSRGEINTSHLAGAIRWQWKYEKNAMRSTGKGALVSNACLLEVFDRNQELRDAITPSIRVKFLVPGSVMAFLLYQFSLRDADMASVYLESVATGADLAVDDAVLQFRSRMQKNRDDKKYSMRPIEIMALGIKAWNFWRRGQTCGTLIWRATGPSPEAFPEILD